MLLSTGEGVDEASSFLTNMEKEGGGGALSRQLQYLYLSKRKYETTSDAGSPAGLPRPVAGASKEKESHTQSHTHIVTHIASRGMCRTSRKAGWCLLKPAGACVGQSRGQGVKLTSAGRGVRLVSVPSVQVTLGYGLLPATTQDISNSRPIRSHLGGASILVTRGRTGGKRSELRDLEC